jgi:hypothetical protein
MTTRPKQNDLFITTLHELHSEAPAELLSSLRAQLKQIKLTNPNCAQTAEACLEGLASDQSSLLHVLTAAYLINGGVMIKHQAVNETVEEVKLDQNLDFATDFDSLEEELNNFSISINGDLKPKTGSLSSQHAQAQTPGYPKESLEHS